jgi:hypothetical protein
MPTITRLTWIAVACLLSGCGLPTRPGHSFRSLFSSDRPLAIATFEENRSPIAPNSHGIMVGYIPRAGESGLSAHDPEDATFTYLVDFRVTASREWMGRQIEIRGVRRIFFNPDGARASFADPSTFTRGYEVETDTVRLSGDYTPEESRLRLKMRVNHAATEPFEFEGHAVAAPEDEPRFFVGRYRENVGGWVLSASPESF